MINHTNDTLNMIHRTRLRLLQVDLFTSVAPAASEAVPAVKEVKESDKVMEEAVPWHQEPSEGSKV